MMKIITGNTNKIVQLMLIVLVISMIMAFKSESGVNDSMKILERMPKGTIVAWSPEFAGSSQCPSGWKIADGTDGTPDLRDRFLMGTNTGDADSTFSLDLGHSRGHDGAIYAYYKVPTYTIVYIVKM